MESAVDSPHQCERVGFLCRLEIAAAPDGLPQAARSLDLSVDGVGATTQAFFKMDQLVNVTFFLDRSESGESPVAGRVASFAPDIDTNRIDIQFLQRLSERENMRLFYRLLNA